MCIRDRYEVVAGARRLRAAKLAELEKLPVRVVKLTDAEAIEAQCVENLSLIHIYGYARDYGFGKRVNNDIGQVSLGILINGVAKISVSRAFGPSQTYIDSTTMAQTTINNFKAWSFGIAYQSAAPATKP